MRSQSFVEQAGASNRGRIRDPNARRACGGALSFLFELHCPARRLQALALRLALVIGKVGTDERRIEPTKDVSLSMPFWVLPETNFERLRKLSLIVEMTKTFEWNASNQAHDACSISEWLCRWKDTKTRGISKLLSNVVHLRSLDWRLRWVDDQRMIIWLGGEGLQADGRDHVLCARISLGASDCMLIRLGPLEYLHNSGKEAAFVDIGSQTAMESGTRKRASPTTEWIISSVSARLVYRLSSLSARLWVDLLKSTISEQAAKSWRKWSTFLLLSTVRAAGGRKVKPILI